MVNLLISIIFLLLLVGSSHIFVDQAVALSKKFKLGSFIIGFVILSLGTSLPELVSSSYSVIGGHTDLSIANVIGSNIVNVTLILGIIPLFTAFKLSKRDVHFNIPLIFISTLLFVLTIFLNANILSPSIGLVFIILFVFLLFLVNKENKPQNVKSLIPFNLIIFLVSLVVLVVSGKYLVEYLVIFSKSSGISESLLGLFITAIGTSLPEFITTIVAIKKGNAELGIGNILGSNLFNTFFILSAGAQIIPLNFTIFRIDLVLMCLSLLLIVLASFWGKRYEFSKKEGFVLILFYVFFVVIQIGIM